MKPKLDKDSIADYIRKNSDKTIKEISEGLSEMFNPSARTFRNYIVNDIAKEYGIVLSNQSTKKKKKAWGKALADSVSDNIISGNSTWDADESKGQALFAADVEGVVNTLEQALEHCEADLDTWEVEKWRCSKFNTTTKDDDGNPKKTVNTSIRINFKRRETSPEEMMENFLDSISKKKLGKIKRTSRKKGNLLEIDAFDPHFGKDSWVEETGEIYDLDIAEKRYEEAIDTIFTRAERLEKISKVLLPIGNDWFHFDNINRTTTKGTPQDSRSKLWELWGRGFDMAVSTIKKISKEVPVDVVIVPSNHDYITVLKMGHALKRYFDCDPNVNVDSDPKYRKYYKFGVNGIGLSHGDGLKETDVSNTMLSETRGIWGDEVKCMEYHLGHFHKKKSLSYPTASDDTGICIRYLRSLSGVDAWHFWKGYTKGIKGAEGFVFNRNEGLVHTVPYNLIIE